MCIAEIPMTKTWLFSLPYHPIVHILEALLHVVRVGRATINMTSCAPNKVIQSPSLNKAPLSLVPLQVKRTSYTSISSVKLKMCFFYFLTCTLCQCQYVGENWKTELLSTVLMSATRGTLLLQDISRNRVTLLTIIYLSCAMTSLPNPTP